MGQAEPSSCHWPAVTSPQHSHAVGDTKCPLALLVTPHTGPAPHQHLQPKPVLNTERIQQCRGVREECPWLHSQQDLLPKMQGGQSQPCSPRLWDFGTCVQAAVGARGAQLAQRAFSHPAGVWPARSLSSIAAAVQEHEALGVQDAAQPGAHPHSQANPGLRVSSALGPCWGTDTHLSSRATGAGAGSGWCSWRSAAPGPRS